MTEKAKLIEENRNLRLQLDNASRAVMNLRDNFNVAMETLLEIGALDYKPQLHNFQNPKECAICKARKAIRLIRGEATASE